MVEAKRIDAKEFREFGYLQEVNRCFFHPLGLAMEVIIDEEADEVSFGGIWDSREDPEGFRYGEAMIKPEKAERVAQEWQAHRFFRQESLGYVIQPVPGREKYRVGNGDLVEVPLPESERPMAGPHHYEEVTVDIQAYLMAVTALRDFADSIERRIEAIRQMEIDVSGIPGSAEPALYARYVRSIANQIERDVKGAMESEKDE